MAQRKTFLDLPKELRITIYELVLLPESKIRTKPSYSYTNPDVRGLLEPLLFSSPSAIEAACRQIHHEFHAALSDHAFAANTQLVARVTDFDFTYLITFIDAVKGDPQNGPALLATTTGGPKIAIELHVAKTDVLDANNLSIWFRYRTAFAVPVSYTVIGEVDSVTSVDTIMGKIRELQTTIGVLDPGMSEVAAAFQAWGVPYVPRAHGVFGDAATGLLFSGREIRDGVALGGDDEDDEDDEDEDGDEGEDEEEDEDDDVMSSEEDFTDEELSDAE